MSAPDITVVVTRHARVADDIVHIVLESPAGTPLPAFAAGAHIDVELPNGLVRQYSLLGDPAQSRQYELGVLREAAGRGGSRSAHDVLRAAMQVRIGAPRYLFALVPARAAFLDRLRDAPWADRVRLYFDDGDARQKLDAAAVLAAPPADAHLYVCGPKGFMDQVIGSARAAGWADANIHAESFAAHDVEVPLSCEQGIRGSCVTRVLAGEPDHCDIYFSDAERAANDCFTLCCSRSKSAVLVLDL